jgi:hypothetical protein
MKRFLFLVGLVLFASSTYYLFFKTADFEINFKAKTLPGDLIQTLRIWNRSIPGAELILVDSFKRVTQKIIWNGRTYVYQWNFSGPQRDSVTHVNVQIVEPENSLKNRFLIPFTSSRIETDAEEVGRLFYKVLTDHLKITKVRLVGETQVDSSFCVCKEIKSAQIDKANGMMKNYQLLSSFTDVNSLDVDGRPMVYVNNWNHNAGMIDFYFCFPIVWTENLPKSDSLVYRHFKKQTVLQAEYNGNYITSDRAWYEIIRYAALNGYQVDWTPIELFHDNPNLGMNEFKWKADVFLPVKE